MTTREGAVRFPILRGDPNADRPFQDSSHSKEAHGEGNKTSRVGTFKAAVEIALLRDPVRRNGPRYKVSFAPGIAKDLGAHNNRTMAKKNKLAGTTPSTGTASARMPRANRPARSSIASSNTSGPSSGSRHNSPKPPSASSAPAGLGRPDAKRNSRTAGDQQRRHPADDPGQAPADLRRLGARLLHRLAQRAAPSR